MRYQWEKWHNFFHRPRGFVVLAGCMLIVFVFTLGSCGNVLSGSTAAFAQQASAQNAQAAQTTGYPIKVFFSKFPQSNSNFAAVFPVNRVSPTVAVGTFSIQLLIAGPAISERDAGYFSELNSMLSGPSNCSAPYPTGGPDFKLTLDKRGSVTEKGTATLRFCRTISSPGIGADARVQAQINATLKQFSTIKKVVILTKTGHCFADGSGLDLCLH
ncbi:MAG: GerMN domain-containing protein [Ktedonobacteraceae bacterium]|nr:GerMN domain-containing protein [Ktedonobacteraceae bacterium]